MSEPLLQVSNLVQEFTVRDRGGVKAGTVHAVSDVSFELNAGETLGLVGETGSGKSTLARAILQAPPPKSGSVRLRGTELVDLKRQQLIEARRQVQMVFQDPFGSLDPKWRARELVEEPLIAYKVGYPHRSGTRASTSCSTWSGSTPPASARVVRASCPAARRSGSRSPERWRSIRR